MSTPEGEKSSKYAPGSLREVVTELGPLGWVAFGGPAAHIATLHDQFVVHRQWIDEKMFAEFLGMGQGIPGPTSTQMVVALATVRGGFLAGIISLFLWCLPGLIVMIGAGIGSSKANEISDNAIVMWLQSSLGSAGAGLVAVAAWKLGGKLCTDDVTKGLAVFSLVMSMMFNKAYVFPSLLVFGGAITYGLDWRKRNAPQDKEELEGTEMATIDNQTASGDAEAGAAGNKAFGAIEVQFNMTKTFGGCLILAWLVILIVLISIRNVTDIQPILWLEVFYRIGSLIFGGGQVVLPMLMSEVVEPGWITSEQFFTGLALIQALPGPVFNFSAYIGAIVGGVGGGLICFCGLFGPGVILIIALLPFWKSFREISWTKPILVGVNASAAGLVMAAVWLIWKHTVKQVETIENVIFILSFVVVTVYGLTAPKTVLAGGAFGLLLHVIVDAAQ
eukprot:GFYU01015375.1.p1 GENE.GFYU01015375.1~~GFYU01015375.1.p1  ORF type:complete len:447 (+),score=112.68 GFYU01015375.1:162-1502(+)